MIRQLGNVPAASASGKHPLLRRLKPARNLTLEVVEQIAGQIRSGRLSPGERLPTEQELMSVLGVSRTVIREAVAALRAEGLVVTRQGAGAFVASDESRVPFRLAPEGLRSIEDVLQVMELRLAIEIEAAAIAARRAGAAAIAVIGNALQAIDRAIDNGEAAVNEDFAFHRAIAAATGNPRFLEFLEFLGRHVIPRQSIRAMIGDAEQQRRYLRRIQREHARIFEALRAGRPAEARQAMRTHLTRGLERYRQIAALSAAAADGNSASR